MRRRSLADVNCSVARALDVVGDPWTLLIVRDLFWGRHRFNEFQESLGIPRTTLTARLAALVDAGVLETRPYQDHPPRHEYHLTDKGRALRPVVISLLSWGDEWSGFEQPPVELVDRSDDHVIDPVMVDRVSGQPVDALQIEIRRTDA
ncbi:MAG: helix-turn-helix domain-containing protein [Actinomycetota bacterium]